MTDRWAGFSHGELDELALSLDHRLAEAENGNAYVYTHFVGPLLVDLYEQHPEQLGSETIEDVRSRVARVLREDGESFFSREHLAGLDTPLDELQRQAAQSRDRWRDYIAGLGGEQPALPPGCGVILVDGEPHLVEPKVWEGRQEDAERQRAVYAALLEGTSGPVQVSSHAEFERIFGAPHGRLPVEPPRPSWWRRIIDRTRARRKR